MSRQTGSTSQPASGTSTPSSGHALPPKPPGGQSAGFAFKPRNVTSSVPPRPASSAQPSSYNPNTYPVNDSAYNAAYSQPYGGGYDFGQYAQNVPVAMHNPFAQVGGIHSEAEAEHNAQLQQWQSNYNAGLKSADAGNTSKMGNANNLPLKFNRLDGATAASAPAAAPVAIDSRKTVVRQGGGQKWEDSTLLEWGNHHRIFVGNLAGEVTDESLLKAFSKYTSVQKARVIRDKRTTKSKSYGFVSFSDADEYFQAAKEMNGKYIGSHPVQIKRAETEIKASTKKDERKKHQMRKDKSKQVSQLQDAPQAAAKRIDPLLGPQPGQGVVKGGKKVESKYKVLG